MRLNTLAAYVAATFLVLCFHAESIAEADQSQIPDLEQKVGKGWQCFAMPSGFDKVGVVFEQRKDKSVFYVDDLKETGAVTAPVAIGSISTSKHFSLGAAIKLISAFFPSLNVSYDYQKKTTVMISGAEETAGGEKVSKDAIAWAQTNLNQFKPESRLFVVREAILASGLTYTFDKSTSTAISAQLSLTAPKTATASSAGGGAPSTSAGSPAATAGSTPGQTATVPDNKQNSTVSPPNAANQIAQTFNPKIGICIHPDEMVLGSSFAGEPKAITKPVTEDLDLR
jgi:hypothetical protein